jgi:hypothetical protein
MPAGLAWYVVVAILFGGRAPATCLFRRLTGRRCPLCGVSHSIALAARGRWQASRAAHPLGIPLLAYAMAYLAGQAAWTAESGQPTGSLSSRGRNPQDGTSRRTRLAHMSSRWYGSFEFGRNPEHGITVALTT